MKCPFEMSPSQTLPGFAIFYSAHTLCCHFFAPHFRTHGLLADECRLDARRVIAILALILALDLLARAAGKVLRQQGEVGAARGERLRA